MRRRIATVLLAVVLAALPAFFGGPALIQAGESPREAIESMDTCRRRMLMLANGVKYRDSGQLEYLLYLRNYAVARELAKTFRQASAVALAAPLSAYSADMGQIDRVQSLTRWGEITAIADYEPALPRASFSRQERILTPR